MTNGDFSISRAIVYLPKQIQVLPWPLLEGIKENTIPVASKKRSHSEHSGVTNTTNSDSSAVNPWEVKTGGKLTEFDALISCNTSEYYLENITVVFWLGGSVMVFSIFHFFL